MAFNVAATAYAKSKRCLNPFSEKSVRETASPIVLLNRSIIDKQAHPVRYG